MRDLIFPYHLAKKFTWFNNWSFGIIWELLRGFGLVTVEDKWKTSCIMFNAEEAKLLDCMKSNKTGPHKSL
jgi:hypothetical protein